MQIHNTTVRGPVAFFTPKQFYSMFAEQRPRPACAVTQSDQGLQHLHLESVGSKESIEQRAETGICLSECRGFSQHCLVSH